MLELSREELRRYSRHIILGEVGLEGQQKLKSSKVLVIGAGGLGAPVLQYLTAAGIGKIGIVDFDVVEESNLQRQVIFNEESLGLNKAEAAEKILSKQNSNVQFEVFSTKIDPSNALEILSDYDVIVDGSDNFPTRYLVNDACVIQKKPLVYASIFRFEGQVSVFNLNGGPNYRDLFPIPPPPDMIPNCSEGGVLGVLPGIIGSIQANETIKILTGIKDSLSGRLFIFDSASLDVRILKIKDSGAKNHIKELIDYEIFCGTESVVENNFITCKELNEWRQSAKKHKLIDVREKYEFDIVNLGGELLGNTDLEILGSRYKDTPLIFMCRTGVRSRKIVNKMISQGFNNVFSLEGGILNWQKDIDTSLKTY